MKLFKTIPSWHSARFQTERPVDVLLYELTALKEKLKNMARVNSKNLRYSKFVEVLEQSLTTIHGILEDSSQTESQEILTDFFEIKTNSALSHRTKNVSYSPSSQTELVLVDISDYVTPVKIR